MDGQGVRLYRRQRLGQSLVAKVEQAVAHLGVEPLPLLEADSVAEVGRAGGGLGAGLPLSVLGGELADPRAVASNETRLCQAVRGKPSNDGPTSATTRSVSEDFVRSANLAYLRGSLSRGSRGWGQPGGGGQRCRAGGGDRPSDPPLPLDHATEGFAQLGKRRCRPGVG
jgi:hypothetical protein